MRDTVSPVFTCTTIKVHVLNSEHAICGNAHYSNNHFTTVVERDDDRAGIHTSTKLPI